MQLKKKGEDKASAQFQSTNRSGEENIKKLFALISLSLKFTPERSFTYPENEHLLTLKKK